MDRLGDFASNSYLRMGSLRTIGRYWHSLRHLRAHQVYGRILFDWRFPKPHVRPAPPLQPATGWWQPCALRRPSLIGPNTFRLLNVEHSLETTGWDGGDIDLLWRFNQHYFDDLNAEGAADRARWHIPLMQRWVRENPPGVGTGWRPYPNSLRIVNWVKWALAGGGLPADCVQSLATQARWQRQRIEYHYLGNHLLANAKALVFAGCFFGGNEADEWRRTGLRIYAQQLPEQILPDGGHYELSPMYQSLMLEDLLDLVNLMASVPALASEFPAAIRASVNPMRRWLAAMCHPDGEISFFNDAAFGVAPTPSELSGYAARLGFTEDVSPAPGLTHLRDSGFVRMQRGPAIVIADVGEVCAPVCPAHAHADTLSFEMSVHGQRVLVNSGVSQYGDGAARDRQRGTAAHNTVVIDGRNSSDVWSSFRVATRAHVIDVSANESDGSLEVHGAHSGYRRLPGAPTHRRLWRLTDSSLTVQDNGLPTARAEARFHLAPGVAGELQGPGLPLLDGSMSGSFGQGARIEPFEWHPEFGTSVASRCVAVLAEGSQMQARFTW
jgi:uncharacterized heparinase superfamily protein